MSNNRKPDMTTTPAPAAMPPLPEAEAWRTRYRSEPGMIGHYPWSYTGRKPRLPARDSYEADDLFTADQMHAHVIEYAAAIEAARLAGLVDAPKLTLPPMDADLADILGTMCFECIHLARMLRASGQVIATKAEAEQAAVLYWLLGFYFSHGARWRAAAMVEVGEYLDAAVAKGQAS